MEEILERQLLIRGRAFATFSTICESSRGLHAARDTYVVQACLRGKIGAANILYFNVQDTFIGNNCFES